MARTCLKFLGSFDIFTSKMLRKENSNKEGRVIITMISKKDSFIYSSREFEFRSKSVRFVGLYKNLVRFLAQNNLLSLRGVN